MPDVDQAVFRQLLGRFATGVTVLTTTGPDGAPVGMTANSLASVSLDPPLLSVCVDRAARLYVPIGTASHFAVNVLAEHQEELSRRFAAGKAAPFAGVGYHLNERGLALLDGAIAHIECARHAVHPTGDHDIVIGRVIGGATGDGRPLVYYRGGYASLS